MSNKPTEEKQTSYEETVIRFKSMVKNVSTCMFTTIDEKYKLFSRPMATVEVDEHANLWFFTNEFSEKVNEISRDNEVHLIYSDPKQNTYFTVKGTCMVVLDRARMTELWRPSMKSWMPGGLEDPKLCLLKVITEEAHYWSNTTGKMKMLVNKLKGKNKLSGTTEGQMKLQ